MQNMADDIILHASNNEQYDKGLHALLFRLEQLGLTLNLKKCAFRVSTVKFLGFIVSDHGMAPAPSKVDPIVNFHPPITVADCRSFLRLVNIFDRFFPDLATIAKPIRHVNHKGIDFEWGTKQDRAFRKIKAIMAQAQTLGHFDPIAEMKVISDASPYGLGAVMVQGHPGSERVVAYGHSSLTNIEQRYSQNKREELGIEWACEHFMMYLCGLT